MPDFTVTFPTREQIDPITTAATDVADLGEQVAAHLYQRRWLISGYSYDALIGTDSGAIRQAGRVVTFDITQEQ